MHGPTAVHAPLNGPADVVFLQAPSTASSGRKLMTEILGGSYGSFPGPRFLSSIVPPHRKPIFHSRHNLRLKPRVGYSGWEARPADSPIPRHRFLVPRFSLPNP